jgi:methylmalonyl-CoA/ethylmalonyl-CoA epimerase
MSVNRKAIQNPKSKIQNLKLPQSPAPSPQPPTKLHHIGIAVGSLEAALPVFEKLVGKPPESEEVVEEQKVRVVFFQIGETRLELLEATSEDSPIARFVSKRGQGLHHIAIAVPDLAGTLRKLENAGVRLIDREPRRGAENEQVAFLHPASTAGVLIELVEES